MLEKAEGGATAQNIFTLIDDGDVETIKAAIRADKGLLARIDTLGQGPFLYAASQGLLDIVKWLLAEGLAIIKEKDNFGNTALLCAAFGGHLLTVQWLLDKGKAVIKEKNNQHLTALLLAAYCGHLLTVKWLLQEGGATITETNNAGNTALLHAAYSGKLPTVKWLLEEGGANITETNKAGNTALLCAACNGQLPTVRWLLEEGGANITETNNNGDTALLSAARRHVGVVGFLLMQKDINIGQKNKSGWSALKSNDGDVALVLYTHIKSYSPELINLQEDKWTNLEKKCQKEWPFGRALYEILIRPGLPRETIHMVCGYLWLSLLEQDSKALYSHAYKEATSQRDEHCTYRAPGAFFALPSSAAKNGGPSTSLEEKGAPSPR